jgi:SNF2 family DNA or RNA helicase
VTDTRLSAMALHATLFPHQEEAIPWLRDKERLGCILADDMGLGKTVMCCALMCSVRLPTIVVAPASLVDQWVYEVQVHTDLTVEKYDGKGDMPNVDVVVTSHNRVMLDVTNHQVTKYEFAHRLVIDEAHRLKNRRSATSRAFKEAFGRNTVRKILLTGTPICNDVNDMISLLLQTNREPYNDYEGFWYRKSIKDKTAMLMNIREQFLLRRTKETELGHLLPMITVNTIKVKTNKSVKAVHEWCKELDNYRLVQILRMRQTVNHATLLQDAAVIDQNTLDNLDVDMAALAQKMEVIVKIVNTVPIDEKVVIFSQWKSMLELIQACTAQEFIMYHGGMTASEKTQAIQRFKEDPDVKGLIISLRAGGCGLNLIEANHAIIAEPYWNYAEEKQAIDRIYRIGQTKPVTIHRMLMHATVENWMNMKQQKKKKLADKMVDNVGELEEVERDAEKEYRLFNAIMKSKNQDTTTDEVDEILGV